MLKGAALMLVSRGPKLYGQSIGLRAGDSHAAMTSKRALQP